MYIALRNHTTYSLCKGAIKIYDLVNKAKSLNMAALGIMDCRNLFGALEFSLACKKSGIQPILGAELLINFQTNKSKNLSNLDLENLLVKIPLIAKNETGYKNLMYLVSHSYLNRQNGSTQHINFDLLKEKSAGLIFLSGFDDGLISKMIGFDQEKDLEEIIKTLKNIFGSDFYIELSRHFQNESEKKTRGKIN